MLATFAVGQVLWSMLWFFLFIMWLMLLFHVFADIFRSSDLSGFAKVMWLVFVVIFPYLGVFVYLIARGGKMAQNSIDAAQERDAAMQDYIRSAAGSSSSVADEIERLAALKANGTIDEAEFQTLKAKLVS